ncbi:MAG: hypothetical protein JNK30_21145 [Phenylobacterium sp.]|uniref:hypothetical protein n=1 Tax=Phenylobacterium sp. TaxID=1871053 RepID=UPI001A5A2455|nr:hypothetical protein [Phenylobacterium sp.]MBL8773907.1 hypothetical protein [Phenylobacterium sp.]
MTTTTADRLLFADASEAVGELGYRLVKQNGAYVVADHIGCPHGAPFEADLATVLVWAQAPKSVRVRMEEWSRANCLRRTTLDEWRAAFTAATAAAPAEHGGAK